MGSEDRAPAGRVARIVVFVLVACSLFLVAGFLLKGQCLGGRFGENSYKRLCYNDLQPLYGIRLFHEDNGEIARVFPYVEGSLEGSELRDGAIEYPVLTGVFMYLSGLLVSDADSFFRVSALLLAPFALLSAYLLTKMSGRRALLWAASPALILYAFHNWDLLVVAASVVGFYLWSRDRPAEAAIAFGVGASFKMYPIIFLAPLALDELRRRGFKPAALAASVGAGTFALINAPFALVNFDGWWATYGFHSQRGPNFDSIWFFGFPTWTPERLNTVTAVLTVTFFVGILGYAWLKTRGSGRFPMVQTSAAMFATFLLWNKVHSPQYTLWLLPFFALAVVHIGWWIAYSVADFAVYYGVFRWFYDFGQGRDFAAAKKVLIAGVWVRAALLLLLIGVFLRARRAEPELRPEPERPDAVVGPGPVTAP